jgi:hypothetical protein
MISETDTFSWPERGLNKCDLIALLFLEPSVEAPIVLPGANLNFGDVTDGKKPFI